MAFTKPDYVHTHFKENEMSNRMNNKVALVTGGTTGMGLATAKQLAVEGAKVVISGRNPESGAAAEQAISSTGGHVAFIQADVSDSAQVDALIDGTIERFGGLHLAFNNAGMEALGPIGDLPDEVFEQVIKTNVNGLWYLMKREIGHMLPNGGGTILNTSSVAGSKGMAGLSAYSASKHAVNGMTLSLALEYAEHGVRINGLLPGPISTPMMGRISAIMPGAEEQFAAVTAVKRPGTPEEIAAAATWLLSDEASFVYATLMPVDGGMLAL